MKYKSLLLLVLLYSGAAFGQWSNNANWSYDLGTQTGTYTNTSGSATSSTTNATTTGFLPAPPSGNAGVYINGTASSGSFTLNGDRTLTAKIATTSLTRFSLSNVASATDVVKHAFTIKFSAAIASTDAGNFIYAIGNNKGNLFNASSNNSVFRSSDELFTALRWTPTTTANSTSITFAYRLGSDASSTTTYTNIDATTFVKGGEYAVEVYGNNSATSQTYTRESVAYTLPANTFHIWVNGTRLGSDYPRSVETTGTTGLSSGTSKALANGLALNSFLFSTNGGTNAAGTITLSSLNLNYLATVTPVSLISFTGSTFANSVELNWKTASESNSGYFEILRSIDGKQFESIGTVAAAGNSASLKSYSFKDFSTFSGTVYYQLKQVDLDGSSTLFPELVTIKASQSSKNFSAFVDNEGVVNADVFAENAGVASFKIFNLSGLKVAETTTALTKGNARYQINTGLISSGIYVLLFEQDGKSQSLKFVK